MDKINDLNNKHKYFITVINENLSSLQEINLSYINSLNEKIENIFNEKSIKKLPDYKELKLKYCNNNKKGDDSDEISSPSSTPMDIKELINTRFSKKKIKKYKSTQSSNSNNNNNKLFNIVL